jgi:uncharacterized membrane protein
MFLKLYLLSFSIFLVIDGFWLTLIAKNFYAKHLGYLMAKTPNLLAALLFYLIFIVGAVVLVLMPALEKNSLSQAILFGALFGLCSYATYDLTNLATIKDWPVLITIIDLIWGTVLSATVSGLSFYLARLLKI